MRRTETAGGVVLNAKGDVLVVNQRGNSWSLPKGHIDPGETALQAARREIAEESGITKVTHIKPLGSYQRYRIGKFGGVDRSELKRIHMFLFRTKQTTLKPTDPYNPEARWVSPGNVSRLLTHRADKAFFRKILRKVT